MTTYNYSCRRAEWYRVEEYLLAAAAHEDPGYTCGKYKGEEERCPYIGQKLLDTIQMG